MNRHVFLHTGSELIRLDVSVHPYSGGIMLSSDNYEFVALLEEYPGSNLVVSGNSNHVYFNVNIDGDPQPRRYHGWSIDLSYSEFLTTEV